VEIPHNALMKPGFIRLNLSYFASEEELNYILNAIEFIAEYAWRFLPLVSQIHLVQYSHSAYFDKLHVFLVSIRIIKILVYGIIDISIQ
jgi:hypothetical protein